MSVTPQAALDQTLDFLRHGEHGQTIGVAVSGGSDSMALLVLTHTFAKRAGLRVIAATVDHGLRTGAAAEAATVAGFCAKQGISHQVLRWNDWDGDGNLQASARAARYDLLTDWAADHRIDTVVLGHTQDDLAETFLMNLARGSGVDGLSGMIIQKDRLFLRPLLTVRRAALQDMLRDQGIDWADDPSNDDTQFDRVKARQMMQTLGDLGLTTDRLVQTADHMTRAQNSLIAHADTFIRNHAIQDGPDLVINNRVLRIGWSDTEPRVLASAIMWVGGADYRPRFKALCDAAKAVLGGDTRTLHGVKMVPGGEDVRLIRELGACRDAVTSVGGEACLIWDSRWRVFCDAKKGLFGKPGGVWPAGLTVRALGEAVSEVTNWRKTGLLHASAKATPAVFDGDTLISAPAVGFFGGFSAQIASDFHSSALTH
jgi:tRNA(Ile)-lysidine synthase